MKNLFKLFILTAVLISSVGCKKYLDINSDPDTPQFPDASSVFPAMLSGIPRGTQYDGRFVSRYIQNFGQNTTDYVWDLHGFQGFPGASDAGGDIWRQCYYGLGANLNYIINEGVKKGQWDYVGAAYALKAMMFQMTTDMHGEIIFKDAFKENTSSFAFDSQESVYKGVDSLCRIALGYLSRTDLSPSNSALSKGDFVYTGDKAKWIKFTNGLLARNFHRLTNKANYKADSVIYYADLALASGADDFLVPFDASKNDDSNFFGTFRDNLGAFRQTKFVVAMLDGTALAGVSNPANRDPRMKQMLSASGDTTNGNGGYRGVDAGLGDPLNSSTTSALRVASPFGDATYGNPSAARFDPSRGKYLFRDKVVHPIMTYSEMQFMKAEASFIKSGANAIAYTAYLNGIDGHFKFINRSTFPRSNTPMFTNAAITTAEQTSYTNSENVKKTAATLTLTDIMLQKYIALWGWGFLETWVDMRRYHYTDLDPTTALPVYKGYQIPTKVATTNPGGKLATRVRPRYNSEYVWNFPQLEAIGATLPDYHVKEMWFSQRP
jgi:hypothetical protein